MVYRNMNINLIVFNEILGNEVCSRFDDNIKKEIILVIKGWIYVHNNISCVKKKIIGKLKRPYIKNKILSSEIVKIVPGAGKTRYEGWISIEVQELDITSTYDLNYYFANKKIDNILLEHVIEHIDYKNFIHFLVTIKPYLKKGAIIRIAVPDRNHPSEYVRLLTGVNGLEPGADDHKYFYGIDDFENIACQTDYKLDKVEYFDNNGIFHKNNFDLSDGYISRCSKNYKGLFTENNEEYRKMIESVPENLREQFYKLNISYTSLLADFINE
ncbi:hypothetical protein [Methanolobus vulcani]|uniref:Methyltransferase domain-containing protein n=1 Tax=Methanolobus vulcani TaxID=38026 RepID=A0A7Z8KPJ1_9EURY|nr:hypothetical protein [Methanolobus vulcani]TQD23849.1 hypothetical protein FKV42_11585 [Methanolobus vulcani]